MSPPPPLARSRVVLVADATEPIGRATAIVLAEHGHVVLACGADLAAMSDLPRETHRCGVIEVSDARVGERAARAKQLFGRLDALVVTSGPVTFGALDLAAVDLLAPLQRALALVAESVPLMLGGRVVLASALPALPFAVPAAAIRGAFEGLAEPLRLELRARGTQLITVATDLARPGSQDQNPSETLDKILVDVPDALATPLRASVRAMARQAPTPAAIADVIARALLAPRPKPRYVLRNGGRIIGRPTRPLEKARAKI